jgi:hypothetical protein
MIWTHGVYGEGQGQIANNIHRDCYLLYHNQAIRLLTRIKLYIQKKYLRLITIAPIL